MEFLSQGRVKGWLCLCGRCGFWGGKEREARGVGKMREEWEGRGELGLMLTLLPLAYSGLGNRTLVFQNAVLTADFGLL